VTKGLTSGETKLFFHDVTTDVWLMHSSSLKLTLPVVVEDHKLQNACTTNAVQTQNTHVLIHFVKRVQCSVLGPSVQERHWGAGVCPGEGNEAGEGSREQISCGVAEGAGAVQSGEEEAEGGRHCSLQLPERRL